MIFFFKIYSSAKQLLIRVRSIKFALDVEEPLYCSLSVHDVQTKQKLTEDFNFDLNSKDLKNVWGNSSNLNTNALRCCISLLNSHNRLSTYLIIRVYRHLSAEPIEGKSSKKSVRKKKKECSIFSEN